MKATAHIKQHQILDGNTARVDAVITSKSHDQVSEEDASIALQAATDHNLVTISNTLKVIEHTPFRTTVRAMMAVASEAIPFQKDMDGFQSVSNNIYMDKSEKIWSLRESESGKVLVRSHVIDDQDEIQDLLNSCSNVLASTSNTRDRDFFQSVSSIAPIYAQAADVVSFAHAGEHLFGIVVASHVDENEQPIDGMTVLPYGAEDTVSISSANITENYGDLVSSSSNENGYEEPADEMISESNVNALVSYWKKVYGHNAKFWSEFESRIRNHKFA